jgi:outer membrane protein W
MKINGKDQLKNSMKLIKFGLLVSSIGVAVANSDYIEDQFSGEIPIDIDGSFSRPTESSKLEQVRKKLEKQNEEMVHKKIEDIRVDNEKKLTQKLQSALTGNMPLSSSSNVEHVSHKSTESVNSEKERLIDLNVSVGVSNISSSTVDLETSLSGKISVESKVHKNVLVGLGLGYTNVTMTPLTDVIGSSYYSAYYGSGYYNVSGEYGQTIDYDQLDISANGKFLFGQSKKLRPYVGLGLVYSRFNMDSNATNTSYWNSGLNQATSVDGSFLSMNANVGARLMFSELIGMNLELGYTKGIGGVLGNRSSVSLLNPDSIILNDIASEIATSNIFGIQAGLLFSF